MIHTYNDEDRCRSCDAHFAEPHGPECPRGIAVDLRDHAETLDDMGLYVEAIRARFAADLLEGDANDLFVLADHEDLVGIVNAAERELRA